MLCYFKEFVLWDFVVEQSKHCMYQKILENKEDKALMILRKALGNISGDCFGGKYNQAPQVKFGSCLVRLILLNAH